MRGSRHSASRRNPITSHLRDLSSFLQKSAEDVDETKVFAEPDNPRVIWHSRHSRHSASRRGHVGHSHVLRPSVQSSLEENNDIKVHAEPDNPHEIWHTRQSAPRRGQVGGQPQVRRPVIQRKSLEDQDEIKVLAQLDIPKMKRSRHSTPKGGHVTDHSQVLRALLHSSLEDDDKIKVLSKPDNPRVIWYSHSHCATRRGQVGGQSQIRRPVTQIKSMEDLDEIKVYSEPDSPIAGHSQDIPFVQKSQTSLSDRRGEGVFPVHPDDLSKTRNRNSPEHAECLLRTFFKTTCMLVFGTWLMFGFTVFTYYIGVYQ